MKVHIHFEKDLETVFVLPSEHPWFTNAAEEAAPAGLVSRDIIFPNGDTEVPEEVTVIDGVYVYYEHEPDLTNPSGIPRILKPDSVKVYDKSAKEMADAHQNTRGKTFRMKAVRDSIQAHMNAATEDSEDVDVGVKLFELKITPEKYIEKNELHVHEDLVTQGSIVYVPFGEAE